ncbi:MAG: acetylxylan esterase [Chloroflexota bacterium]
MNQTLEAFWKAVDDDLALYPMSAALEPLPQHSTAASTTYAVRLTSVGPYRISGVYSVPNHADARAQVPGLLITPRYGSVNHIPDYYDRERYAVFQLTHRGQRRADQPFAAAYPGLLTLGIDNPETYIYRGIVADCIRGAEFLRSRPELDGDRVGIQGDDLALITAARRPGFTAILASELLLYRLLEASQRTDAYPVEELNDYLRSAPESRAAVADTLAYFDPIHHIAALRSATMLTTVDADGLGGQTWLDALRSVCGGSCETYRLSHKGAVDQVWLDAWLAGQLGAEPRSRFREQV